MIATANQPNAKDALKVLLNQYEELINYLKINGAHLNTIRAEYLFQTTDYQNFLQINPKEEKSQRPLIEFFPTLR